METSALHAFPDAAAVAAALPDLVRPGDAVLVKGSRGVSLESVVEALLARYGEVRG
jgi:UDP-N-acetylmuramyl pentapeptide synthase